MWEGKNEGTRREGGGGRRDMAFADPANTKLTDKERKASTEIKGQKLLVQGVTCFPFPIQFSP